MTDREWDTLLAFASNRLNVTQTARAMFLSPNAVCWRLNQIRKKTGLDPHDFYDLKKLLEMEARHD